MQILVFEFATSGGIGANGRNLSLISDLWGEGELMRRLVAEDLQAAGHSVVSLLAPYHPTRPKPSDLAPFASDIVGSGGQTDPAPHGLERLRDAVKGVDATILIAPECDGLLARLADEVQGAGGRLLSPDPTFIRLASDKQRTAEWLAERNIPVPVGRRLQPGQRIHLPVPPPWVVKPLQGAGSMQIARWDQTPNESAGAELRLEAFCPGMAASVAALGGPSGWVILEPCRQRLRDERNFEYLGGSLPLSSDLSQRAGKLARQALQCLPNTQGYVGLDLVLGPRDDGSRDYVIEVNPRLTSSYAGLRQAAEGNLAGWMVDVACGRSVSPQFSPRQIDFSIDGSVRWGPPSPD